MNYAVYASGIKNDQLLLVDENLWVINGDWQIEKKGDVFYCVFPHETSPLNIHLVGYIDYDGDYNSTLERFRNGEGQHTSVVVAEPELCKKKYYGIECSCSKCKR